MRAAQMGEVVEGVGIEEDSQPGLISVRRRFEQETKERLSRTKTAYRKCVPLRDPRECHRVDV